MVDAFCTGMTKTNDAMEHIAKRIGYAQDLSDARKKVYGDLLQLPLDSKLG